MKITFLIIFLSSILLTGCETVHQGAKEVGRPIGSTMKTMGGVTEGANEGYADDEGPTPYNR